MTCLHPHPTYANVISSIPLILVALALAAAPALAGCGGDEESGGEATSQGGGKGGAASPQQGSAGPQGSKPGGQGSGGGEGLRDPGSTRAPADPASLPAPTEGSKRAAPGVPVSKGGDNSIQTWGLEASAAEREEVTATLKAFYDARAAGEWARACTYLASRVKAEFSSFIRGASGNAACAKAMRGLATGIPDSAFAREARIDYVLSLRTGEGNAFLIYTRTGERKVFANAFAAEEDGTWKVVSVGPTVIY